MLGPEGAALALTTLLEDHIEAKVDELARRLEAVRLPLAERRDLVPKLVEPFDVLDLPLDSYPALLVIARETLGMVRVDVDDATANAGQARYLTRYAVRTFGWARARQEDPAPGRRGASTDRARKRLILAVREVYLDHQAVEVALGGTPDLEPDDDAYVAPHAVTVTIDERTLRESYSDVVADDDGPVAAAYLDLEVTLDELVPVRTAPPARVAVATTILGHPALDD